MTTEAHPSAHADDWQLFRGDGLLRPVATMPPAPPWRRFGQELTDDAETTKAGAPPFPYRLGPAEADIVNAALQLRRPLLVTGHPGTGKSRLAYAIAHELGLGEVLHWPVNSRSTLQEALYRYDAIGRLRETAVRSEQGGEPIRYDAPNQTGIGEFIHLGPVGTALVPAERPRVLLVDELDKGDIDLPNDLLTVFEDGFFTIPELARLNAGAVGEVRVNTADVGAAPVAIRGARVTCTEFPVVVITSNGEREFPPAFLRRCLRLDLPDPDRDRLLEIVTTHLGPCALEHAESMLETFLARRAEGELATDQFLNAVFLRKGGIPLDEEGLLRTVLRSLGGSV